MVINYKSKKSEKLSEKSILLYFFESRNKEVDFSA